jgi:hypothetical protein
MSNTWGEMYSERPAFFQVFPSRSPTEAGGGV